MFIFQIARVLFNETSDGSGEGLGGGGGGGTPPKAPDPKTDKPTAPETISMPSDAFKARLAEESTKASKKLLKDLGFDKPEDAKAALQALKTLQDEKKTEHEKLQERIKQLEPLEGQARTYQEQLEELVNEQFDALPEAWQKAIDKVADGKALERQRLMKTFREQGLLGSAPSGAPAGKAPAPPAPSTKAPAGGPAPKGGETETAFTKWAALQKQDRLQAGLFWQANSAEIERTRPADE